MLSARSLRIPPDSARESYVLDCKSATHVTLATIDIAAKRENEQRLLKRAVELFRYGNSTPDSV